MALTAQFEGLKCNDVPGYILSATFTPEHGFWGNFFAYLMLRYDADTRLEPIRLGAPGPQLVGRLSINGGGRAYSFPGITLVSAEPAATRRERQLVLEFNYPHRPDVAHKIPAILANESTTELYRTALGDDFTYGIDSFPEQLLGFRARQSKADGLVVRFSALRNARNSFLSKLIEVNNAQQGNSQGIMPEFEIKFAQKNFKVNKDNLVYAHVTEGYGVLDWPPPPLGHYVQAATRPTARLTPPAPSAAELVEHELNRSFEPTPPSYAVETATLVFLAESQPDFAVR
jgi:hypothetical protein